jgi:hypothetical protein
MYDIDRNIVSATVASHAGSHCFAMPTPCWSHTTHFTSFNQQQQALPHKVFRHTFPRFHLMTQDRNTVVDFLRKRETGHRAKLFTPCDCEPHVHRCAHCDGVVLTHDKVCLKRPQPETMCTRDRNDNLSCFKCYWAIVERDAEPVGRVRDSPPVTVYSDQRPHEDSDQGADDSDSDESTNAPWSPSRSHRKRNRLFDDYGTSIAQNDDSGDDDDDDDDEDPHYAPPSKRMRHSSDSSSDSSSKSRSSSDFGYLSEDSESEFETSSEFHLSCDYE